MKSLSLPNPELIVSLIAKTARPGAWVRCAQSGEYHHVFRAIKGKP
jgi:hypothetical protein